MSDTEIRPGEPAPATGRYVALNVFGTPTGTIIEVRAGEYLPNQPRGFTWLLLAETERRQCDAEDPLARS